ncbi:NrfD/PsrC family molybdoenzyme membrane anchor subunit [Halosolutus halophilus]|uniref:NrfD/PsrC family molybdoenzyme membrane anchor subunit n=1 Tax=Halosolutus halophilus TaxID=1552990 RepID=UPI002A5A8796|nr:NrfD/PsrC family molybdoenzyme membrane anchor subunit [Halosolutus halophilus]
MTVCPEDAIIAGDMENPETEISGTISGQEVQARKPEKGTEPNLFYVEGDESSITPESTDRGEHYMWSDAPNQVETRGAAREDFDLERAAQSLAESDVSLSNSDRSMIEPKADGGERPGRKEGCGCDSCDCDEGSDRVASDGGARSGTSADVGSSRTERAYELLQTEAKRVYDVAENHRTSWGWEVYSYTWTKSISAGVFLLPVLLMLTGLIEPSLDLIGASATVSAAFLGLTGVLLILDLDRPGRFHWVLLRPNWKSWLVRGAYIITAYGGYLGLVVVGWLLGVDAVVHPTSLVAGGALAAATAVYTAFLFSQSKGRDLWQSPAMPLHMFVQAVVAGAAATALMGLIGIGTFVGPSRLLLAAGLVVHLALIGSEILTPHQTEDAEEAAARIVRGEFSTAFWIGGIALGIAVPLILIAISGTGPVVAAAGIAALAGLFAFEYCWITAPQTISLA